jgi:hypothetical protein
MHMAIAVAKGDFTLGETGIGEMAKGSDTVVPVNGVQCDEGDVLYCALEDNLRRLQSRMQKLLAGHQAPKRLHFHTEMPRLTKGGLDVIRDWIKSVPKPRLVIIDTLAMVREPAKREQTAYDADYMAVVELRNLAAEYGLAIVIVHHLRKAEADDAYDTVSGTLGLTGAPDSVLILKRDSNGVVLHGRGRDMPEIEKAMKFDNLSCTWAITGEASEVKRSTEQQQILQAIAEAEEPIGAAQIASATGMRPNNIRFLLFKLAKANLIAKAAGYGKYCAKGKSVSGAKGTANTAANTSTPLTPLPR